MTWFRESRDIMKGQGGRWFGRMYMLDRMHSSVSNPFEYCLETMINKTDKTPLYLGGRPLIRGSYAGGGPHCAYLNTEVAGGADSGVATGGCFNNDAGVALIVYTDQHPKLGTIQLATMTTAPDVGSILTQATSGATLEVTSVDLAKGYVTGIYTGTWSTLYAVTDGDGNMVPASITPRHVSFKDTDYANSLQDNAATLANGNAVDEMIIVGIRGLFETFVMGDDAGTGYNGDIADGTDLTYNDDIDAYVAANYHDVASYGTEDVYVNPDNVYAHALEAAGDNSDAHEELIVAYHRHNEPVVYVGGGRSGADQGVSPEVQEQIQN